MATREGETEIKPTLAGVYILFRGDTPVYVGQSGDIYRRISEHTTGHLKRTAKKEFDFWEYIEIFDEKQRVETENLLIKLLKPEYNNTDYEAFGRNSPSAFDKPPNKNMWRIKYFVDAAPMLRNTISFADFDDLFGLPRGTAYKAYKNGEIPKNAVTGIPICRIYWEWVEDNCNTLWRKTRGRE